MDYQIEENGPYHIEEHFKSLLNHFHSIHQIFFIIEHIYKFTFGQPSFIENHSSLKQRTVSCHRVRTEFKRLSYSCIIIIKTVTEEGVFVIFIFIYGMNLGVQIISTKATRIMSVSVVLLLVH